MKSLRTFLIIATSVLSVAVTAAPKVNTTVLTELDKFEGFDAHLFHAGHLWVGRSRKGLGGYYRLEVYDASGKQVQNLELKHSLRQIVPYGDSSVMVVGVSAEPNISQYTVVSLDNGVQVRNQPVRETAWADRFVGDTVNPVFTDPGGNQNDADAQNNLSLPAQTLFRLVDGEPRYLKTRLPDPQEGMILNGALYLIQFKDITGRQANLVRVDLKTEAVEKLFPSYRQGLVNLTKLSDGKLAMVERFAGQVLVFDPATKQITATIKVAAGTPKGLSQLGSCLVVGSEQAKQVSFYDLTGDHPLVSQWDASGAGAKFFGVRNLAADPLSGRVYLRSAYACSPQDPNCGPERNSVILLDEPAGTTFKQCQK